MRDAFRAAVATVAGVKKKKVCWLTTRAARWRACIAHASPCTAGYD
jgi:hypothetical protein